MNAWRTTRFGDVCEYDRRLASDSSLPYLGLEQIESGTGRIVGDLVSAETESSSFEFSPNHVLYGRLRPYLNKVALPRVCGRCSTEIFPLKPTQSVAREFLYYWLIWPQTVSAIDRTSTGARMPRANMSAVAELPFSYPSLAEQKRIVAILDEVFEGIAKAAANVERNQANAREVLPTLIDRLLRNTEGAQVVDLEELVERDCSLSYGIVQPGDEVENGLPIVRPTDLGAREVGLEGLKRINPALAVGYQRTTLKGRDLLLCVRGTTGVVSQASPELAGANVTRGIVPIRRTS